ncbi:MAG: outer membrane lipoprotein LolB [Methylococcales bacterium]|nr:outer membrane lipoprotein LolB [Methylococcales bacterium]
MPFRFFVICLLAGLLGACAEKKLKPDLQFQLQGRDYLYTKNNWSFVGRVAISDKNNSLSASINWQHQKEQDNIELAGPFGQGRTLIMLADEGVVIDYGDKRLEYMGDKDQIVSMHLGVRVPVSALRYWVLGLVAPNNEYRDQEQGFEQAGWLVKYQQMQNVGQYILPRKIRVEQGNSRVKLIINQWNF